MTTQQRFDETNREERELAAERRDTARRALRDAQTAAAVAYGYDSPQHVALVIAETRLS